MLKKIVFSFSFLCIFGVNLWWTKFGYGFIQASVPVGFSAMVFVYFCTTTVNVETQAMQGFIRLNTRLDTDLREPLRFFPSQALHASFCYFIGALLVSFILR